MVVSWVQPTLYNLTSELIWPEVINRARSHPEEICWRDNEEGKTVLHHAARHFYSADVIREMLNCSDPSAAAIQDRSGKTPLHVACWNGSSEIIRILLSKNRTVASIRDNRGRFPLHHACSSVSLPCSETISILIKAFPQAATTMDYSGKTPLTLLCDRHESRLQTALDFVTEAAFDSKNEMSYNIHRDNMYGKVLRPFWSQLRVLLNAIVKPEYNNQNSDEDRSIVHALSSIPQCPSLLFDLVVKLYPTQVREKVLGSLPLHCAAECPTILNEENTYYVLRALLILFPRACQIPDTLGRLPLHLAILSGKTYHGALKYLFEAFPDAISMRDGQYSLLPFMLPALLSSTADFETTSIPNETITNSNILQQQSVVDSTLELLRLDPSGVKMKPSSE